MIAGAAMALSSVFVLSNSLRLRGFRAETGPADPRERVEPTSRMRHGWAVATENRDALLADADRYFAVCARDGDVLVGASLNEQSTERALLR